MISSGGMGPHVRRWVEPEDIAQQALIETLGQLDGLDSDNRAGHFVSRLRTHLKWRIADARRAHRRDHGDSAVSELVRDPPASRRTMGSVTRGDEVRRVDEVLGNVPAKYADVLRLRIFDDYDWGQIGEELSITTDAARRRYYRVVDRLAERLGGSATGSRA